MEKFWKTSNKITPKKIEGLGDWIEQKITEPLGIKAVVETVTKAVGIKDCGCGKRKEGLNNLVPFNSNEEETKE